MIKITMGTKVASFAVSTLTALTVFGSMVYFTSPEVKPPVNNNNNLIDFSKIRIGTPAFAAESPFGSVPQNAMDNAPLQAPTYIPGSPMVPQMPNMPGRAGSAAANEVLRVIGVLPPDVVILQKGGRTITAKSGSSTEFGVIGTINKEGASVGGSWIEFSR